MFSFGTNSLHELQGVHQSLRNVAYGAIKNSAVDFAVHDGLRTLAEQQVYVATGVSRTLASKHLLQPDGYGHAIDAVPYVNGKLRWEWEPIYLVAEAMRQAAIELDVDLTWGGVWDRPFLDIKGSLKSAVAAYVARRKALKKSAFLDGPHFELRI